MQRFPQETTATIEDFRLLDWQAITVTFKEEGYPAIWSSLSTAAKDAIDQGEYSKGKVLWLLADACSMMLHPESQNEPFKPLTWLNSSCRSAIPDDFTVADFVLIAEIAAEAQHNWIKARLADLVWFCKKQRRAYEFALMAIDAYTEIPLNIASWSHGGRDCWERAAALAKTLRMAAGSRLEEIEADLLDALKNTDIKDRHLAKGLSDLLYNHDLARERSADIAFKLETLAQAFERENEFGRSRELFAAAAKWYRRAANNLKFAEMTCFEAETWVKEVAARTMLGGQVHIAAVTFIGNAIQTYRTIPHSERDAYKVEERLVKLQLELRSAGQNTLKHMHTVSSDPVNLSEFAEKARKEVAGKTAEKALLAFANLYSGVRKAKLKESSQQKLQQSVFRTIFSSTHFSADGRVVRNLAGSGPQAVEENTALVWTEMISNYTLEINLITQGMLLPALEVLNLEHRLRENDFIALASQSPTVPKDRIRLFAKGLYLGYDGDFVGALHLLVPQIENMVRQRLRAIGCRTSTVGDDRIETENGLSTLIVLPEIIKLFGEDLGFELRALFCDAAGPNLRNEVAHGLLSDSIHYSVASVYAWWLSLKLVLNSYWNTAFPDLEPGPNTDSNQQSIEELPQC